MQKRIYYQSLTRFMRLSFIQFVLLVAALGNVHAIEGYAQPALDKKVSLNVRNQEVESVFREIEQRTDIRFVFSRSLIRADRKVSIRVKNQMLYKVLDEVLTPLDLKYRASDNLVIISRVDRKDEELINALTPDITSRKAGELISTDINVTGRVSDEKGEALPGVSIMLKGTQTGTASNADGSFSLNVPDERAVLVFSYVGYVSQEVVVSGRTRLEVALVVDEKSLEEVVVVGYGTMKKSDLTGSIASVTSEEINSIPTANVLQALTGRVAGVNISQNTGAPGAQMSIQIRGTNSIQGGNEPLYVIDGFPTNQSMLLSLNSSDIESMEILKDASATAIYGSRGANGVVIVTTKRGTKKKTQIDFETSYGVQTLRKKMELMNAGEYATFINRTRVNGGLSPYFTEQQIDSFGDGFDWQDELFRPAAFKKAALNINGGTDDTQYSIGGSLIEQDGIVKRSFYDRYSLVMNLTQKLGNKLKFDVSSILSYINTDRKDPSGGNRGGGIIGGTLSAPPTSAPMVDGSYVNLRTLYPFMSNTITNPINNLNESTSNRKENRAMVNASLIYNPIPEITIKILGGLANHDAQSTNYTTNNILNTVSSASMGASRYRSLLNENTISYEKTIDKHKFSVLAGFTYQDFLNTSLNGSGQGFISDVTESFDLAAADLPGIPTSSYSKSTLVSGLTRINYILSDKYLATFTFRGDGASQYSKGDKWGYFPSGALAWRISNEDFFNIPSISNMKLRASWGVSGNQAIGAYTTLTTLTAGLKSFGEGTYITYAPGTRLPNDLRWETTETRDFGLDIGMFNGRLNITTDYYIKHTRDLLNTVGLPLSMGYTTTIQNIGAMQNKGFELGIEAIPIAKAFEWRVNFNASINRNKVLKLYNSQDILGAGIDVNLVQDYLNILREGHPVGSFWGYLEDGYDENGQIIFKDLNGDSRITLDDKTFIGDPNPNFIYGIQSVMSYGNFDFTFFIQGSQGNDIYNVSSINNTLDYGIGLNMPRDVYLNHWTPENRNAKYPIPKLSTNVRSSNRFVEDGSYLRLKNIEIAYNLRFNNNAIKSLRMFVNGQNLLTLTKYSWWDPEVNSRSSAIDQGIDHFTYPTAKNITVGLQFRF